jgi:hypothetical protein
LSVDVTLMWPMVAVLGFVALTALVVALGASSTARYEFERNGARKPERAAAPRASSAHPAGSRAPGRRAPAPVEAPADAAVEMVNRAEVAVATRPAAPAPDRSSTGWWLVGEATDGESLEAVAGPFPDKVDADWAALSSGLHAVAVYGAIRPDGGLVPRTSPEERAWLSELGDQLDRLPEEWDTLLTDTDPLTTLVVEIAAAVVEAGLPLYAGGVERSAGGGVFLTPEPGHEGVLVSWRTHDRMSLQQSRGSVADAAVQELMNATLADVLAQLGFVVEAVETTGCPLVTALRG